MLTKRQAAVTASLFPQVHCQLNFKNSSATLQRMIKEACLKNQIHTQMSTTKMENKEITGDNALNRKSQEIVYFPHGT